MWIGAHLSYSGKGELVTQLQRLRSGPFSTVVTKIINDLSFKSDSFDDFRAHFKQLGTEALEKQVAALRAAVASKDGELNSLRTENTRVSGELIGKEGMINRLYKEMDALLSRCAGMEERLRRGEGGAPTLSDSERVFISLLSGPLSLLGVSSNEIMEMFRACGGNVEVFTKSLKRRTQVALHPDKITVLIDSCPEPSLKEAIKKMATRRFQMIELAIEEVVQQLKGGGVMENKWRFKKLP